VPSIKAAGVDVEILAGGDREARGDLAVGDSGRRLQFLAATWRHTEPFDVLLGVLIDSDGDQAFAQQAVEIVDEFVCGHR
jgi:hypothetical protein